MWSGLHYWTTSRNKQEVKTSELRSDSNLHCQQCILGFMPRFKWEMNWNFFWILFFRFKREFECFSVTGSWSEVKIWSVWRQTVADGCRIWNLTSHHVSPHDMKLRVKLTSGVLCGWDLSCVTGKDLIKHWWSSQSSLHCLHYQKISSCWAAHLRVRSPEPEWRRPRRRRRWAARSGEPAADSSSLCPGRPLKTRETKPAHLMIRDVKHHYVTEWRHGSARYTDWSRQIKTQLNNKYIDSVLLLHF